MKKRKGSSLLNMFPRDIFVTRGQDDDLFAFQNPKEIISHYGPQEPIRVIVYRQVQVADINPEYSITYLEPEEEPK